MPEIPALTLLFGLLATTSLHLARALTRQGIDTFKLKANVEKRKKKSAIWMIGFTLNNIVTVFMILGLMFGPATIYNSVFGLGLIVLLLYAYYIMDEKISRREILGAALITIGTVGIGIIAIFYSTETPTILYDSFFTSIYILLPITAIIIVIGYIYHKFTLILFAPISGIIAAIGSDLMYVGNLDGGFSPYPSILLPIYVIGGALGVVSFLLSQLAFYRGAHASIFVPLFNGLYIFTPFVYEIFIFEVKHTDFIAFFVKLPFLILVFLGIYFIVGILIKTMKSPMDSTIES